MVASENIYRAAFESSMDALLLLGEGRVAACNATARRFFGGGAPLHGREIASLLPPSQPDGQPSREILEQRAHAALGGAPQRFMLRCCHPEGGIFVAEITLTLIEAEGGGQALALAAREGVSYAEAEQARAESEETLRSVVESLPGLIMTLDKEYRITSINRILPGFSREKIIGANALDYVPPEYRETARRSFEQVFRTGQSTSYETVSVQPSESGPLWFAVYVGAIQKGEEVVALTLATDDITPRKRLEEELRRSLQRANGYAVELEQKNRLLADENAERRRTEEDLRRQREVVSRLSTPIIKAWDGVLVLPIIGALDSERAAHMMERLLAEIAGSRARFAVLDLTGVETMDTATVGYLVNIVRAASLLGSFCLVSGISPVVAQTMIGLGSATQGFRTFGQMQDALKFALREAGVRGGVVS